MGPSLGEALGDTMVREGARLLPLVRGLQVEQVVPEERKTRQYHSEGPEVQPGLPDQDRFPEEVTFKLTCKR